jgi:hypothetical protein
MPQHAINEIHGAWFDPANHVVQFNGQLRGDLFSELLEWENKGDLCLAIGTSLSGMNADRLVETCGEKALKRLKKTGKVRGGSVIIGFQCTRLDDIAALRIYSPIDVVMNMLATEMGLDISHEFTTHHIRSLSYQQTQAVQSSKKGKQLTENKDQMSQSNLFDRGRILSDDIFEFYGYSPTDGYKLPQEVNNVVVRLNLNIGQRIKLANGERAGCVGEIVGKDADGTYTMVIDVPTEPLDVSKTTKAVRPQMEYTRWRTKMGKWMILGALDGKNPYLPIMNAY